MQGVHGAGPGRGPAGGADQSAPAAATVIDYTTDTADAETVSVEDELKADSNTDQIPTKPEAIVAESVVSVSEGAGAARITTLRSDKLDTPLIWWTSEHTADADKDYISITQKTVTDRSFNEGGVLHIPLVDDSLSEPRESFFVNIGRLNPQQGQIERIAAVRVDIDEQRRVFELEGFGQQRSQFVARIE